MTRIVELAREQAFIKHAHYALMKNTQGHVQAMGDKEWGFTACPHPDCVLVRADAAASRAHLRTELIALLLERVLESADPIIVTGHGGLRISINRVDICEQIAALRASRAPSPQDAEPLTFARFSEINRQRCESADGFNHRLNSWSTSDWFLAAIGELGESANIAKKLNRYRDGIPGNKESEEVLRDKLRKELGDVYVYLDLLAQSLGIDIGAAAVEVFNAKSEEIGCHIRIVPAIHAAVVLDPLTELVEIWRRSATFLEGLPTQSDVSRHDVVRFRHCADELEAVLRSAASSTKDLLRKPCPTCHDHMMTLKWECGDIACGDTQPAAASEFPVVPDPLTVLTASDEVV